MGYASGYRCASCGYSTLAMRSGYQIGGRADSIGLHCHDCRELHVAKVPAESRGFEALVKARRGEIPAGVTCPESPDHRISVWTHPGACPRCAEPLEEWKELAIYFD